MIVLIFFHLRVLMRRRFKGHLIEHRLDYFTVVLDSDEKIIHLEVYLPDLGTSGDTLVDIKNWTLSQEL